MNQHEVGLPKVHLTNKNENKKRSIELLSQCTHAEIRVLEKIIAAKELNRVKGIENTHPNCDECSCYMFI